MKDKNLKIALVIPAYNEGLTIQKVIKDLKKAFSKSKYFPLIVVVNDASSDNTGLKARRAGAIVINHSLNSGSGGATLTGLSYVSRLDIDLAATLDGDGQHDVIDVLNGLEIFSAKNVDLLVGSRLINKEGMSKVKIIGNKGLTLITYALFGVKVTDSQSGLRIFSKRTLSDLKWKTSGYEFCSEMLWRAKQKGFIIGEYPIKAIYTDYSISKGQSNWNGYNIVKNLLKRRVLEFFNE